MSDTWPRRAWLFLTHPKDDERPVRVVTPSDGDEDFTLNELQNMVGGLIERLPIPGHEILVNEEGGYLEGFDTNARFVTLFQSLLFQNVLMGPKLVAGDVIVFDTPTIEDAVREEMDRLAGVSA